MRKIIYLFALIPFIACQNKTNTNKTSQEVDVKDTVVNEKTFVALGGQEQYVEITGASSKNPVLLFLHGGPGWP